MMQDDCNPEDGCNAFFSRKVVELLLLLLLFLVLVL